MVAYVCACVSGVMTNVVGVFCVCSEHVCVSVVVDFPVFDCPFMIF